MRSHGIHIVALSFAGLLAGVCVYGGIVLRTLETTPSGGAASANMTGNSPKDWLEINFGVQDGASPSEQDTVHLARDRASAPYTGSSGNQDLSITLNFRSEDVTPVSPVLRLHNTVSGRNWEYAFNNATRSSRALAVPFSINVGWTEWGNAAGFWDDLTDVDWTGTNVVRKLDAIQQDYGIDSWGYLGL